LEHLEAAAGMIERLDLEVIAYMLAEKSAQLDECAARLRMIGIVSTNKNWIHTADQSAIEWAMGRPLCAHDRAPTKAKEKPKAEGRKIRAYLVEGRPGHENFIVGLRRLKKDHYLRYCEFKRITLTIQEAREVIRTYRENQRTEKLLDRHRLDLENKWINRCDLGQEEI